MDSPFAAQAPFVTALKAEALLQDDAVPEGIAEAIGGIQRLTRGALAQMRTMLFELRSESPESVPIEQLLRNAQEATEGRTDISIDLTVQGECKLPADLHVAIYRITQEALNNVVRHSKATHASVVLEIEPFSVRLVVQDEGCGFEPGPWTTSFHRVA